MLPRQTSPTDAQGPPANPSQVHAQCAQASSLPEGSPPVHVCTRAPRRPPQQIHRQHVDHPTVDADEEKPDARSPAGVSHAHSAGKWLVTKWSVVQRDCL
uniref:Uncharacterized protein n=1 Tax=Eutreptiella gymnastica TaxID=73025 RepID=A0A7S4CD50_9EUGL